MDFKKANYEFGQRVKVIKTDSSMDGIEGIISGIASINWFDVYIISIDSPMTVDTKIMPTFQAFTMPETCLEAIRKE